jgi:uncharacterized protein YbaA (DUF1428 family)
MTAACREVRGPDVLEAIGTEMEPKKTKEIEMGVYVDGYILPLPKDKIEDYREMATIAGKIWREHGALDYWECIAEDVKPGKLTSFPQAVLLEEGETVIFSWVVYKSREDRDRINALVMKDPRLAGMDPTKMPFDGKRMFWGGFDEFVHA